VELLDIDADKAVTHPVDNGADPSVTDVPGSHVRSLLVQQQTAGRHGNAHDEDGNAQHADGDGTVHASEGCYHYLLGLQDD